MLKQAIILTASYVLLFHTNITYANTDLKIYADEQTEMRYEPYISDDCTMIYYEDIVDILGVKIQWDKQSGMIEVIRYGFDDFEIPAYSMKVNDNTVIQLDESTVEIEKAPELKDDILYLPLRAVCELLCATVEWNGDERSIKIETESRRPLLNRHLDVLLPVSANAVEVKHYMMMEDDHFNAWYISYKTEHYDVQACITGTCYKSCGDIETDAKNLGYKIDRDSLKKNSTNENISEIFVTDNDDITSGRILLKTEDDFLWEMDCDVLASGSKNIYKGIEKLKEVANTINLKMGYDLSERDVSDSLANSYSYVKTIRIPEGYMIYAFIGESSAVNIFKVCDTSQKRANLDVVWGYTDTDEFERTKEGSFLGKPITWYIYSDGIACANSGIMRQFVIKDASESELDTFIDIVSNMKEPYYR